MKRIPAALLSVVMIFAATACNIKEDPTQTSQITFFTSPEPDETGTVRIEPDVSGVYLMNAQDPQEGDPVAYRLELLIDSGKLGVLFTYIYSGNDDNDEFYAVDYEYDSGSGTINAKHQGDMHNFELSADGKTVDVVYTWTDGTAAAFNGHYERKAPEEEYKEDTLPEPSNDPNTPNGAVDARVAKAARDALGLTDNAVLTADDLAKVDILYIWKGDPFTLNGIEYFTNLQQFNVMESDIKDISPLVNISSLESVSIVQASLDTIPDLSKCEKLTDLALNFCAINDITPVTKIRSLKSLSLIYNHITSIAPVKDLENLETINLEGNPITDWDTIAGNNKLISALHLENKAYGFDTVLAVNEKARRILSEIITADMTELEKEIAIYKKVQDLTTYDMKVRDCPKMPAGYYVLMEGFGICGDYAEAIMLLMNMAGIECYEIESDPGPENGPEGHVWNLIKIDGDYYEIDATWDDTGDPIEWWCFNVSRAHMEPISSHHLDRMPYRVAQTSMQRLKYLMVMGE